MLPARIARAASFAVPLGLGIIAASPEPYWLDSPEFTAAVQTLGIPHPPGHPLYVMLAKPLTLLPLGGVAFRVALASALFGALASVLLCSLALAVVRRAAPGLPEWIAAVVACAVALLASVAPGWWFQCVRAEVYSLQILLVLGALYPLVLFCLRDDRPRDHLLYGAAFIAGLGLTNHHFIMLAAVPAAIPPLVAEVRHRGWGGTLRLTGRLVGAGALGLLPYLFLPIRSATGAAVSLGGVHSLGDLFWVVSAKVYQKSMTGEHQQELASRSMDAAYSMMGEIGPVALVAAVAGLYLLLRKRETRMTGVVLSLMIGVTALLRSIMGFDPYNPDYYGYMLPVLAGLAIGLGAVVAILLDAIRSNLARGPILSAGLALAVAVLPVVKAREASALVDLSGFRSTRLMLDLALGEAAPGTRVLCSSYRLFFVLWSARFIDGSRPDIAVVNPQFFGYPGYLAAVLRADPEMRALARSMAVYGEVTEAAAAALAWKAPLRMEPDLWLPEVVTRYMIPDSPVYRTFPEPMAASDVAAASPAYFSRWRGFYRLLGPGWQEHETWRALSWCHYQDALFLARRGDRPGALAAIGMAEALDNRAPELVALRAAIERDRRGPVDITPFLPGAPSRKSAREAFQER